MENSIIISVIVPVYNGEAFVRRAIDSVLCQLDGRVELILVNDGSTDNSGAICDEYASKHPDIHVIHKPNGGTSSAKNMGIAIAQGKYLTFMDCDDYLEPTTYSQIIPILLEHQPDCLDFGWRYIRNHEKGNVATHECDKNILLPLADIERWILPPLLNLRKDDAHFIFDFCWNKIFKGTIIKQHNIRFDEDKRTWEDRTFLLRHLKHCQSYYSMDKCFYNYVYVPNSLSQRFTLDFFKILLANFTHYRQMFEDRFDFDTQYANNYWSKSIDNLIFRSLNHHSNQELIEKEILSTLQNPQVIHWHSNRVSTNRFEQKISQLIADGKCESALNEYKKEANRQRKSQSFYRLIAGVKKCIRRLIRR